MARWRSFGFVFWEILLYFVRWFLEIVCTECPHHGRKVGGNRHVAQRRSGGLVEPAPRVCRKMAFYFFFASEKRQVRAFSISSEWQDWGRGFGWCYIFG